MKKYTLGETRFLNIFSEDFNTKITKELLGLSISYPGSERNTKFLTETRRLKLLNRKYEVEFVADFYNNLDAPEMDEHNMFPAYSYLIIDRSTIKSNFNVKDKKGFLRSLDYDILIKKFQDVLIKHFSIHYKDILIEAINIWSTDERFIY